MKSYRVVNSRGEYLDHKGDWTQRMAESKNFLKEDEAIAAKNKFNGSAIWAYVPR